MVSVVWEPPAALEQSQVTSGRPSGISQQPPDVLPCTRGTFRRLFDIFRRLRGTQARPFPVFPRLFAILPQPLEGGKRPSPTFERVCEALRRLLVIPERLFEIISRSREGQSQSPENYRPTPQRQSYKRGPEPRPHTACPREKPDERKPPESAPCADKNRPSPAVLYRRQPPEMIQNESKKGKVRPPEGPLCVLLCCRLVCGLTRP